ncbi:unnamed protein product [Nippostrongylus brasiliensis]|uniref:TPR_REGION domain-containing protein n=1 Tax=Nippostrongylus brasiliensis TaxID=27835 RepID=A0A0N4YBZ4_NIPBR|nr:unnamed protein product [Nippostrongylus brasiliensis]
MISNMEEKDRERVDWLKRGRKHALEAHDLNPTNISTLKILCSTTGRLAEESGIRDKIHLGFEFKVANLSFFERLAARTMGTLPHVSMDAALKDLLEAEQLRPGSTENRLYLGRVLYAKRDYAAAKKWLTEAARATCDDEESVEREHIAAARQMLQWKVFQK